MNSLNKNLLIGIAVLLTIVFIYNIMLTSPTNNEVPFSEFLQMVNSDQITEASVQGVTITFALENQQTLQTIAPDNYSNLYQDLHEHQVRFKIIPEESGNIFLALLSAWLPILLIVGVWLFFMKQMQGGGKIMNFSKSQAHKQEKISVTFKDVAGIDEAKSELEEIIEFLKNPKKFQNLGGHIPTGVLLTGRPGTGKTLLAKAVAGEANAGFFSISGSNFVEMFVGVGASRVRDLFAQARAQRPCIIFIDEIDAVGRHRGSGLGGGNDEREQTLNQLLVEMDGFLGNEGIIIIAATNRADVLDPALTRPGRFDRQIVVPPPDVSGRLSILQIHSAKLQLAKNVDLQAIAKTTSGFTGADLENLANEAALLAGRARKSEVGNDEFEQAKNKLIMGSERKSLVISDKQKEITAYHEAGHAILAALSEHLDSVHKVSIIPHGQALGITALIPDKDFYSKNRTQLLCTIKMMLGGRAAEEIVYDQQTTGASNDLERVASLAHQMVCSWGMSKKVGPVYLDNEKSEVFLGQDLLKSKQISNYSANLVDSEVKKIVHQAYQNTVQILEKNLDSLHKVAKKLLKDETINGQSVVKILKANQAVFEI